jgi:glyoxylase-like metal-dependent hydrolase (beta-lactamase superfamily II)
LSAEGDVTGAGPGTLYLRQFLAGRDFAADDELAVQMRNYAYAVGDRAAGTAVLVDPAYAPGELVDLLEADEMRVTGAVLTHYHADHAGGSMAGHDLAGIAELLGVVDVPVHVQAAERPWVERTTGVGRGNLVSHEPGDELSVGSLRIELLHTPGHTPGSQCLLVGDTLLTGDTLFLRGCGRTDLPGGDPAALHDSLVHHLAALPPSTVVMAGHAYDPESSASLGALVATNPVLFPQSREQWTARFAS